MRFTIYIFSYYLKIDNTVKRIVTEKDLTQAKEWHDKGYQYFLDNEDDKAIEDYNKAIELDPNYALAYIDRGFIYYNKGEYDRAIEDFNRTIMTFNAGKPLFPASRVYFGSVYWNVLGLVVIAFPLFFLAVVDCLFIANYFNFLPSGTFPRIKGQWWALIILTAIILYYGIFYVSFLQSFTSIKVSNNGSWSLRNGFGIPIGYIGFAEEREADYMKRKSIYLGRSYQEATSHFLEIHVGNRTYKSCNNDLKSLEKALKEIMTVHKNNLIVMKDNMADNDLIIYSLAYSNRGLAYHHKGQDDMAVKDFNKAIALNPNNAQAYSNRGVIFYDNLEYKKAIEDFSKAIASDPNDPLAYFNRGVAYAKKGDTEKAQADYQKACNMGYEAGCNNLQNI